jgi:hypothetical protein
MTKTNNTTSEIYKTVDMVYNVFCNICLKILSFIFITLILQTLNAGCRFTYQKRSKKIIFLLTVAVVFSTLIYFQTKSIKQFFSAVPVLIILFVFGLISRIQTIGTGSRTKVFEQVNFKAKNGDFPRVLKIQKSKKANKKREIMICKSLIPISEWIKHKDILEHGFNSTLAIKQTKNKQIIKLIKLGR